MYSICPMYGLLILDIKERTEIMYPIVTMKKMWDLVCLISSMHIEQKD
jgi:hypothetical protein